MPSLVRMCPPLRLGAALAMAVFLTSLVTPSEADAQYFGRNKVQYENFDFRILKTPQFREDRFRDLFRDAVAKEEKDRALSLLDFMGIARLAELKAKNLSYGQKKLMEIAAVMMSEPKLILLDEPAGGVNPTLLESIIDRIFTLNKQGITFLIVEHNMDMVMKVCNPIIVMAYGYAKRAGVASES